MAFLDLFDSSAFRKRNQGHFAAIVRVAMGNGSISDEEKTFLNRLAGKLDIGEAKCKEILKNYQNFPINPPTTYNRRLERLYDLVRMIYIDNIKGSNQTLLLEKMGVGLGFTPSNVKYVIEKAIELVDEGVDLDTFSEEIKNMNR